VSEPAEQSSVPEQSSVRDVEYKGAPLDAARGPGLGCFWSQIVLLVALVVLTPLSAAWGWPVPVTIGLFVAMLILLLLAGQTIIFLLRLVAADRRAEARRRPLRSASRTVGELEDEAQRGAAQRGAAQRGEAQPGEVSTADAEAPAPPDDGMRE